MLSHPDGSGPVEPHSNVNGRDVDRSPRLIQMVDGADAIVLRYGRIAPADVLQALAQRIARRLRDGGQ